MIGWRTPRAAASPLPGAGAGAACVRPAPPWTPEPESELESESGGSCVLGRFFAGRAGDASDSEPCAAGACGDAGAGAARATDGPARNWEKGDGDRPLALPLVWARARAAEAMASSLSSSVAESAGCPGTLRVAGG